jgi:uncharacterized membrane protein (UPF0127 family)
MIRATLFAAASLFACASAQAQECPSPPDNDGIDFGPTEMLAVEGEGVRHELTVEIADDPGEQARGLMYRPEIAPDFGMLFVFDESAPHSFYMRNTCASLDILYLRADGEIASIVRHAVPFSERSLPSPGPVRGVLELKAGRAEELGIEPGDRVIHARLGGA